MDAKELKKYLLADTDRIQKVLESAGFHEFKYFNDEIRCALPDMTNPTGVMIKLNESLYTSLFELGFNGDLFGALGEVLNYSFKQVIIYIHSLLGIGLDKSKITIIDPLKSLKSLVNGGLRYDQNGNKLYDESVLNDFVNGFPASLVEEGISPSVLRQFHIMSDPRKERIIFPHYDWEHEDKIVGIKGRTTQTDEEIEVLGTPKYWNYLKGYRKMENLYGFYISKKNLAQTKQLILFEGEKSVLKEYTYNDNKGSSVALGGHVISSTQVEFILKNIPNECEIILAFDKDVMCKETEGEEFIREQAMKFMPFRTVSYIFDSHNLLGEKDSPIDKGYKVWNYLLKWRKQVK